MSVRIWFWRTYRVQKDVIAASARRKEPDVRKENRNGLRNIIRITDEKKAY